MRKSGAGLAGPSGRTWVTKPSGRGTKLLRMQPIRIGRTRRSFGNSTTAAKRLPADAGRIGIGSLQ